MLIVLRCLFACVFQVRTGQNSVAFFIFEFEHGRFAENGNSLIRVFNTRQFDDDAAFAFALNDRFSKTKFVDALFHDFYYTVHRIVINGGFRRIHAFQNDVSTALKVETLPDGAGKRCDKRSKNAYNDNNRCH